MSQPTIRSGEPFLPERRMMYYLFLLGFFAIFSTTISKNPVLPLFSHALGADDVVIGLVAAQWRYLPLLILSTVFATAASLLWGLHVWRMKSDD